MSGSLPEFSPLPGTDGFGETLPLSWVYRAISRSLPPNSSVELEAVELIASAAGEFLALLSFQARGSGNQLLDAHSLFRALRELGFEREEDLLVQWFHKRLASSVSLASPCTQEHCISIEK